MSTHTEHAPRSQSTTARQVPAPRWFALLYPDRHHGGRVLHSISAPRNVVIALTIATIKATLVALFFMHLLHGTSR